jgi:large subunit ribosomal protein L29
MKAKDLREKSLEDLKELEKVARKGTFESRFKNFTNRLDDTSAIRKSRRELARIVTLLSEKARGVVHPVSTKPQVAKAPKAKAAPKAKVASTVAAATAEKPAKKAAAKKSTAKKSEAK